MINDIVFPAVISLAFVVLTKMFMDMLLSKRDVSGVVTAGAWILLCVAGWIGTNGNAVPLLNVTVLIVATFFIGIILYKDDIGRIVLWSIVINLLGMIVEIVTACAFMLLGMNLEQHNFLGSLIAKLLLFTIIIVIKIIFQRKLRKNIPWGYWGMLLILPIGSMIVLNTLFFTIDEAGNVPVLVMLSSGIMMIINFLIFYIYEKIADSIELEKQEIMLEQKVEEYRNQIANRKMEEQNIKNLKHDMNNHLTCLREYVQRGKTEEAGKYIDQLMKNENMQNEYFIIDCGNVAIDAMVNYKGKIMNEEHITLYTHIEVPDKMHINDSDICVILGNAMDNAIEAVKSIPNVDERIIQLEMFFRKGALMIKICNPFIHSLNMDKNGNCLTTKSNKNKHGNGLLSIRNIVQRYDGLVMIENENKTFLLTVLLYL